MSVRGRLDKLLAAGALMMIATGLLLNEWVVKALLVRAGIPFGFMRRTIWIFDAGCILGGVVLFKYRSRIFRWMPVLLFGTAARRQRVFKVVTVALPFVMAEFVIRWAGCVSTYSEKNLGRYVSPYSEVNTTPWIFDNGVHKSYTVGRPEFNYEVRTNSEGVRDIEHPVEKAKDEYRIVGLGDSFMMGFGAPFEQSPLRVLESKLNEQPCSRHVTVISGGVAGSDPVYSYYLFVKRLRKYHPDLVTLMLDSSDIKDIMVRGGMDRFGPDGYLKGIEPPTWEWIFAKSHLVRAFMLVVLRYDFYLLGPWDRREKTRATLPVLVEVAESLKRLGDEDGFEVMFALRPFAFGYLEKDAPGYLSTLAHMLTQRGIIYTDLSDAFKVRTEGRPLSEFFWPIDQHYNAKGYEVLACALEDALRAHFSGPRYPWSREAVQ